VNVNDTTLVVCVIAAAVQVNSSAVHRPYINCGRPVVAASAVSRHHQALIAHRRGSTGSTAGDGSNIPSSSVTTETMVDRSRTSSNSSSESSRHHLNDCPPAQVCVCVTTLLESRGIEERNFPGLESHGK